MSGLFARAMTFALADVTRKVAFSVPHNTQGYRFVHIKYGADKKEDGPLDPPFPFTIFRKAYALSAFGEAATLAYQATIDFNP